MTELVFLSWILLSRVNRDYAVGYEQELAGRAIHSTPVLTGTAPGYIIYWWNRTFYGTSGHLVAHSSPGTSGHLAAHSSLGSFYDLNIHCLVSNSSPLAPDLIRTNPEHDDVTSRSFSNHFDFSHWCAPSFKLPLPFSVWSGGYNEYKYENFIVLEQGAPLGLYLPDSTASHYRILHSPSSLHFLF
jgi:hypothetical protein